MEYDPNDPVEEYAEKVLKEGKIERDFVGVMGSSVTGGWDEAEKVWREGG